MGVPVVTLPGETFAGRHAETHLTNADMREWIAKDEQDYIDIAVKWANDIEGLAKLRSGLREHVSRHLWWMGRVLPEISRLRCVICGVIGAIKKLLPTNQRKSASPNRKRVKKGRLKFFIEKV